MPLTLPTRIEWFKGWPVLRCHRRTQTCIEHTAALDLANDIVVAVMADRQATTPGSLRSLGVDSIRPSVDQIYGSDEGIDITACRVTFEITYQTTGIGL